MKSILFIDTDSQLARSVRALANTLNIPMDLVARKNEVRRLVASGNVGIVFANTEVTTIRYEDMALEIDTIQERNRLDNFPVYYICDDEPVAGENLPKDVPTVFLISRGSSLEDVYGIIERTMLSDQEIEQSGGFIRYSDDHDQFIASYGRVLKELTGIAKRALAE